MNNQNPITKGDHTLYPVVSAVKQEDGSFLMQCVASGITLRQHFALEFAKSGVADAVAAADKLIDDLNVGCEPEEIERPLTVTIDDPEIMTKDEIDIPG